MYKVTLEFELPIELVSKLCPSVKVFAQIYTANGIVMVTDDADGVEVLRRAAMIRVRWEQEK